MKTAQDYLADNLKRLRKAAGFTQLSFSEAIDVSLRGYQKYEQGVVWPEPAKLDRIAKVLGIVVADLFAAPAVPVKGRKQGPKRPPDVFDAIAFLERFRDLLPERKAVVSMLVYDDESYLSDLPDLARDVAGILKGS